MTCVVARSERKSKHSLGGAARGAGAVPTVDPFGDGRAPTVERSLSGPSTLRRPSEPRRSNGRPDRSTRSCQQVALFATFRLFVPLIDERREERERLWQGHAKRSKSMAPRGDDAAEG